MLPKQLQQPEKLESLATSAIVEWIASLVTVDLRPRNYLADLTAIEEELSRNIETVRGYLYKNTPAIVMNNVLDKAMIRIINMPDLITYYAIVENLPHRLSNNMYAYVRWIEVLFTKDITFLSLNSRLFQIFKTSFITKSHLLTGLTTLKINIDLNRYEESSLCSEYAEFFKNIPNLKYLTITCRSNKILGCILDNCKSIIKLDLHKYYNVSTETFDAIKQLPNLETVCLYDYSIDYGYNPGTIESNRYTILKHINLQRQFEVMSFILSDQTVEYLQLLERYPMIESLECQRYEMFYVNDHSLQRYIKSFNHLQHLKELKIRDYRFHDDQVKEVIQLVGRKLEKLQLLGVGNMDLQAFKYISQTCPNLKDLTVSASRFLVDGFSIYMPRKRSYSCITNAEETHIFKNLHNLHLDDRSAAISCISPSTPSSGEIISVLMLENCPDIECIDLHNIDLTKGFFLQVLDKNPLRCLKELRVPRKLDQIVIDRIIETGLAPEIVFYQTNGKIMFAGV